MEPPLIVSPGLGSRPTSITRSALMDPTTTSGLRSGGSSPRNMAARQAAGARGGAARGWRVIGGRG
jgi:hypothetical protein